MWKRKLLIGALLASTLGVVSVPASADVGIALRGGSRAARRFHLGARFLGVAQRPPLLGPRPLGARCSNQGRQAGTRARRSASASSRPFAFR